MKTKKLILLIGDLVILYVSLTIALIVRYKEFDFGTFQAHFIPFSIVYLVWIIVFYIHNLYEIDIAKNNIVFSSALIRALIIGGLISIAFFYIIPGFIISSITPKTNLFLNIVFFVFLFYGWRYLFNLLAGSLKLKTNIAIIGYNPQAIELAKEIIKNPQLGYKLKLIIENHEEVDRTELPEIKITQGFKNLRETLQQERVNIAIVTPEVYKSQELIQNLFECIKYKIDFVNLPEFYENITQKIPLTAINEVWFLENISQEKKQPYEVAKRLFDFIFGLFLLVISLPFWPLIAIIVKLESRGKIFYTQIRVGQGGRPFKIVKFRSMIKDAEKDGPKMTTQKDSRITKFGKFLRKTRLDEIPQIWNIIIGEMSFVGPRAERPEFHQELKAHIPFYQERYLIKPGLSGWAQIKYGYGSSVADNFEKVQYDLYYIKNRSFIFDSSIVLKTINIVLKGGGR
ncbi:sugar transferase [Patescibacteria group bacterium]|nr:sugar transferase [Patescibacteria group bacterium]MBU4458361.1 sugar transferase [Patescibacteria group bacterium]MCG2695884.1 sugar transferase [Candidatus Portnoybacteria bacterium]